MLHLTKHHGLGNDFLVALAADNVDLTPSPIDAREWCDRRRGLGADGLIYALDPAEAENDACMVLLNADGSEAEISGNGIRCIGKYVYDHGLTRSTEISIETSESVRCLEVEIGQGHVSGDFDVVVELIDLEVLFADLGP